jgi:hypothetical protein
MTATLPEITVPIDPASMGTGLPQLDSAFPAIDAANEKFEFLKADSLWNVGKAQTETEFAADTRYEDLLDRYEQVLRARRDDIAATIADPRARENFTLKAENDIALSARTARSRARQLNIQEQLLRPNGRRTSSPTAL